MNKLATLALVGLLALAGSSDQLYIRNRPFKGVTQRAGQVWWVEVQALAQALELPLNQAEGGGWRLQLKADDPSTGSVAAGKLAIGDQLFELQDKNGTALVSLQEAAAPLGLRITPNPKLGTVDVMRIPPQQAASNPTAGEAEASPPPRNDQPLPPKLINRNGSAVQLQSHLVPGRINIVDFYADWCGPCRQMAPMLEGFVAKNPRYCLLKVDIKQWQSPVALQYGLRSIPHIKIFDERGALMSEGDQARAYLSKIIK